MERVRINLIKTEDTSYDILIGSDYIKNEINTKKASEQKKELDQVLLSSENKVIHTTKKRI